MKFKDDLVSLIGMIVGASAMTLVLPYVEPSMAVIDGSIAVQASLRSAWTFVGFSEQYRLDFPASCVGSASQY